MPCHRTTIDDTIKEIIINTGKYLAFSLGTEDYGIGIRNVKEIIGMIPVTAVPGTPGAVKGVVNLRGKVIPVINLRETFDMPPIPCNDRTCIIIVETDAGDTAVLAGVIVDSVSEVIHMNADKIEAVPALGTHPDTNHILGMAKTEQGRVKMILDIDRLVSHVVAADGRPGPNTSIPSIRDNA